MRILGFDITRAPVKHEKLLAMETDTSAFRRGGWLRIFESFSGAWQRNVEVVPADVLTNAAVYACVSLIASDIAKLRIKLVTNEKTKLPDVWEETSNASYSPVLRKPNGYQTRIQFLMRWMLSKLLYGNTYVLKERDGSKKVRGLYVLHPERVTVKVSASGSVFYDIAADNLAQTNGGTIPASEIIHDIMAPLYHDLCGVSPLVACWLAAVQGLSVQRQSTQFFRNGSRLSGLITTKSPEPLSDIEAQKIRDDWEAQYGGEANAGGVAVLSGDLQYKELSMTAVDAQLIDQLKWTAENICMAFHVPPYMIGIGSMPTGLSIEALQQQYYRQCLQIHVESLELLLDEGLGVAEDLGTELDLDGLIRMDSASRVAAAKDSMNGGGMTANEVRQRYHGLGPVEGGNVVLSQQQNFSLSALAKRDAKDDPFAKSPKTPASAAPPQPPAEPAAAAVSVDELTLRAYAKTLDRLRAA